MKLAAPSFGQEAFSFVDEVAHLSNGDAIMKALQDAVAPFGFDRLIITGLSEKSNFEQSVLVSRWPCEFMSVYAREHYIRDDPVARMARSSFHPFEWDDDCYDRVRDPNAAKVMDLAADFGIRRGFLIPIHGPNHYEAAVSMAGVTIELPPEKKPALHLMALYAFERLRGLGMSRSAETSLTLREREVLTWAAQGKSSWEIGEILHIAKRTVDEHMQTASRKLHTVNKTQAVAMALRDGLIDL